MEARPRPPTVEAVLLWLSTRGKQRNLSGRFPTRNPERKKPKSVCSRGGVECDTARHPVPSCDLPEPLPVVASSLAWNLRSRPRPGAARGLYLTHHPTGAPARPAFGLQYPRPFSAGLPPLGWENVLREVEPRGRNVSLR